MPPFVPYIDRPKILESVDDISIAHDKLGNEVGIKIKHNTSFDLYLYVDGWGDETTSLDDVIMSSIIEVKVFDLAHRLVFSKELYPEDVYDIESNYLVIPVSLEEASLLQIDSYKLNVTLAWDGFSYELYTESDGLLIIR